MSENWLLMGPELGQKKQFIKDIKSKLAKSLGEEPEMHKVYPYDTAMGDVVSLMQNGSLFSPHKLVILDNAEDIKAADAKLLAAYLTKPSSETSLILMTVNNRLENKGLMKVIPKERQKIFWEMFENQKNNWIIQFFRQRKRNITPDAVELLLELVMNNTEEMKISCEQLCTHYPEQHTITDDDIEKVIYHSREENVFSLFDKLSRKNLSGSLEVCNKIILSKTSEPIQLIAGLTWQFGRLLEFKTLLTRLKESRSAFQECGIRGKKAQQQFLDAARHFNIQELQHAVSLLAEADRSLRDSGTGLQHHLIQMLIFHIVHPAGHRF